MRFFGKENPALKERKYKEDYGIEVQLDERGRDKRVAVYRGEYYALPEGGARKQQIKRTYVLTAALFTLFYLIYMLSGAPSSYCIYVLPFASCAVFPLFYWLCGLISMLRAPAKMTRVQKENGVGRILRSATGAMILMMIACVGDIIFVLRSGDMKAELAGFALLACAAMTALAAMRHARGVYHEIRTLPSLQSSTGKEKNESK